MIKLTFKKGKLPEQTRVGSSMFLEQIRPIVTRVQGYGEGEGEEVGIPETAVRQQTFQKDTKDGKHKKGQKETLNEAKARVRTNIYYALKTACKNLGDTAHPELRNGAIWIVKGPPAQGKGVVEFEQKGGPEGKA
jgi:hypothetical protein